MVVVWLALACVSVSLDGFALSLSLSLSPTHTFYYEYVLRQLHFDGFVVISGTDTMCYCATALSFLLENLGKPVVFTGVRLGRQRV